MARITLDVDHVAVARGDDLATTDAAKGADCYRLGCAAGLEWRHRRAAHRWRQGADRYRARCKSLEELAARRLWRLSVCCGIAAVPLHLIFIFHRCLQCQARVMTNPHTIASRPRRHTVAPSEEERAP